MKKLVLIIFIATGTLLTTHAASAQVGLGVPTVTIGDTSPTGIANAFSLKATNWKEYVGDKLAYIAAKQVLNQMTVSVVNWINSGFKGKPAFLTNPEGFFLDAADQVTGAFLAESGPLRRLCSPWSVDIQAALILDQLQTSASGIPSAKRYTCTLGSVIDNYQGAYVNGTSIDGFLNGDFNQGGWPAFIALATEDYNNPYGTALMLQSDHLYATSKRQASISQQLIQGKGFLSWESCDDLGDNSGGDLDTGALMYDPTVRYQDGKYKRCTVRTPGSVIANSLETQLGSPVRQLELADNINAIVSALISQLVTQTLQKGLYSLSTGASGPGSGRLYLQQVYAGTYNPTSVTSPAGSNPDLQLIITARQNYDTAIDLVTKALIPYNTALACFDRKYSILSGQKATDAAVARNELSTTIYSEINPYLNELILKRDGLSDLIVQAQTTTLPGGGNLDQLANSIQNGVNNLTALLSGTNYAAAVSSSESDLRTAEDRAENTYKNDAATFQAACDRL